MPRPASLTSLAKWRIVVVKSKDLQCVVRRSYAEATIENHRNYGSKQSLTVEICLSSKKIVGFPNLQKPIAWESTSCSGALEPGPA